MVVIIAEINGSSSLSGQETSKLKEHCKAMGIDEPQYAYTTDNLSKLLEQNRDQKVLLFSNFPPDSSYPESGKTLKEFEKGDIIYRSWDADSYSKSKYLFEAWIGKFNFKTIHFITGALQEELSDEMLKSLSAIIPITVTRKSEWIHPAIEFEKLYVSFMKVKIVEAALKDPFA